MSLRKQLIIIALLLMVLPVSVVRFAIQLEESLRESQQSAHAEQARYIAEVLQKHWQDQVSSSADALVLEALDHSIILDGYSDDWTDLQWLYAAAPLMPQRNSGTLPSADPVDTLPAYKLANKGQRLYLLLRLPDGSRVYKQPGAEGQLFDQLQLRLYNSDGSYLEHMIAAEGPGQIRSESATNKGIVYGVWQETSNGSLLEMSLSLPPGTRALSLIWRNVDRRSPQNYQQSLIPVIGSLIGSNATPADLLYLPPDLLALADSLTPADSRLQLLTAVRQPILEIDRDLQRDMPNDQNLWKSLVRRLLLFLVSNDTSETSTGQMSESGQAAPSSYSRWERTTQNDLASIRTFYPLMSDHQEILGWISLEKHTPQVAAVANEALFDILSGVLALILLVAGALLGYASWLSWRIRHLKSDIMLSLDPEHKFQHDLAPSRLNDEIGDLSRSFVTMLTRLKGYADYMETFASKLTHECRTPLAIVSSSLQLAEQAETDEERQEYLRRAQTGTTRISKLLTAMRQATQLEASIQQQDKEVFDLIALLQDLQLSYAEVVKPCRLNTVLPAEPVAFYGNPELLAQAIDKLIENARDFTPKGGSLALGLERRSASRHQQGWTLYLENQGPQIPAEHIDRLFEPFVSKRDQEDEQLHLGLGLVIVQLVAEYHGGVAVAKNVAGGVRIALSIFG